MAANGTFASKVEQYKTALRSIFSYFDKDGNGSINATELGQVMRELGENPTPNEIDAMMKQADADGNGSIEFNEFLPVILQRSDSMRSAEGTTEQDADVSATKKFLRRLVTGDENNRIRDKMKRFLRIVIAGDRKARIRENWGKALIVDPVWRHVLKNQKKDEPAEPPTFPAEKYVIPPFKEPVSLPEAVYSFSSLIPEDVPSPPPPGTTDQVEQPPKMLREQFAGEDKKQVQDRILEIADSRTVSEDVKVAHNLTQRQPSTRDASAPLPETLYAFAPASKMEPASGFTKTSGLLHNLFTGDKSKRIGMNDTKGKAQLLMQASSGMVSILAAMSAGLLLGIGVTYKAFAKGVAQSQAALLG
eukprot:gnl/MRDRNA2_/MRDRNA2_32096_c0_seq1.p1 gnl/MRDRNA2_/MRDRNA2_32096_c0~~gnl/MRDRNA2_/MRDRNA2_32096_c0_seq1.p1  ORF type:complete len:361 (+),score=77.19 gnl/MRDRNA2_/MRDRNA2_32096_c0_seq1:2-1084(+)